MDGQLVREIQEAEAEDEKEAVDDVVPVAIGLCQLGTAVDVVTAATQSSLFKDHIKVDPCNN